MSDKGPVIGRAERAPMEKENSPGGKGVALILEEILNRHAFVLMEAAVVERLRRSGRVELDPRLEHALLIYSAAGRAALTDLYAEYLQVAREARAPILLCTPTWRACKERLAQAGVSRDVNGEAVAFMRTLPAGPAADAGKGGKLRGPCGVNTSPPAKRASILP